MRALVATLFVLAAGCSQPANDEVVPEEVAHDENALSVPASPAAPPKDEGTPYSAPADPNATYSLLSVKRGEDGNIIAMTRRAGPSGISYSNREIDCGAQLARYIGEGDTREEAGKLSPHPGDMASLVEGSSTHAAVQAACSKKLK